MIGKFIGNPDKVYPNFDAQLDDDVGFKEMKQAYLDAGGRKQAEIEYELGKFILEMLGDDNYGRKYAAAAIRNLKFHYNMMKLFVDELPRLKVIANE